MERLCVRVQQQVFLLRGAGEKEEIQAAKQVLKEARNSRAVSNTKLFFIICVIIVLHSRNLERLAFCVQLIQNAMICKSEKPIVFFCK